MKKITGIEIVLIVVVFLMTALAVSNGYRIGVLYFGLDLDQSYMYETVIYIVPFTTIFIYLAVLIKYARQKYARAYIVLRMFIPVVLCMYSLGYLIGLNLGTEFAYELLMPVWIFCLLNLLFILFNIWLFNKIYQLNKYGGITIAYSVILSLFYLLMFSAIITDSAVHLGLLEWFH